MRIGKKDFVLLIKVFMGILVFLTTLEVCARFDDYLKYGAPFLGQYSAARLERRDSDGLPYNVPLASFEKWQHNSLGFRGPEVMQNKPSGKIRVICLGSSESYGLFESPGKEWPAQLRDRLAAAGYEIVNASAVGFDLTSYNAYLEKHVFALKPDIIILVVSPIMYVTVLEKTASEKSLPAKAEEKSKPQDMSLKKKILANIRILPKMNQVIKQVMENKFPGILRRYRIWNMQTQIKEIERQRLRGQKPLDSVPDIYIDSFRGELTRLVKFIRSRGIEVVLTSYPTLMSYDNIEKYPEIFLDGRRFSIWLSLPGMVDTVMKFNDVIEQVAVDQKTIFFDPSSVLPKSTDYFGDLFHLTDKGAQLFAEGVAARLLSNQLSMHASVYLN